MTAPVIHYKTTDENIEHLVRHFSRSPDGWIDEAVKTIGFLQEQLAAKKEDMCKDCDRIACAGVAAIGAAASAVCDGWMEWAGEDPSPSDIVIRDDLERRILELRALYATGHHD